MAIQDAIKRLIYRYSVEGADKVVAANQAVAATSENVSRSSLSLEKNFNSLERRFNSTLRAQQDYEKVQRQVNAAVAQNPALMERGNQVLAMAAQHYGQVSNSAKLFQGALSGVSGQLVALSAGAGPVGVFLSGLGPWGVAAGVGLGVATRAFTGLSDAADRYVEKIVKIRDARETTRFSGAEIQTLTRTGRIEGLDFDSTVSAITKFTVAMDEVRRGQGGLFDAVRRVTPELALQMAATTDNAKAFDIYAEAIARAGNSANKLLREGMGRGGVDQGRMIDLIRARGGLISASSSDAQSGAQATDAYIEHLDRLQKQIDRTKSSAEKMFGQIFAVHQKNAQLEFAQALEWVAGAAKKISEIDVTGGLWGWLTRRGSGAAVSAQQNNSPYPDEAGRGLAVAKFPAAPVDRLGAQAIYNIENARVTALGSAATAAEKLKLKQLELNSAIENGAITQETYNRALAAARQDNQIQALGQRISLMGEQASIADIVLAKQLEINRANQNGALITKEESAAIIEKTRLQAEYAKLPNQLQFERSQLGRSDIDQTVAARLRSAGLPVDLDSTEAGMIRLNEQLKIGKDLATDFSTGFARDLRNGVKATEALGNALGRLSDRLMDMAINQAISGIFGAILGVPTNSSRGLFGLWHEGGVVGQGALAGRYVHPAYFENANRFATGGIAGIGPDEVPIIAHRNEEVIRRDDPRHRWNGGGEAQTLTVRVIVNDEKFSAYVEDGAGRVVARSTPQIVGAAVAQSNMNAPGAVGRYQNDRGGEYRV